MYIKSFVQLVLGVCGKCPLILVFGDIKKRKDASLGVASALRNNVDILSERSSAARASLMLLISDEQRCRGR